MTPRWGKRTAIGAIILGTLMLAGSIAMLASPDEERRLRCDRSDGRCVLEGDGDDQTIEVSSIEKAYVSHSRSSGHSLQLVTSKGTQIILSKSTMHSDSRREYNAAADEINALVDERSDSLDVRFAYRGSLMPGIVVVFLSLAFVVGGVMALRRR